MAKTQNKASELEDTGPDSIEESVASMCEICTSMIDDMSKALTDMGTASFGEFKDNLGKVKKALSVSKHTSKSEEAARNYFAQLHIDEDELFLMKELGEALVSTSEYLSFIDPVKAREGTKDNNYIHEVSQRGARANLAYGDFFLKMHKRFEMTDGDLMYLMDSIFNKYELKSAFAGRAVEMFPSGVYALVTAYLELSEEIKEEGEFFMPNAKMDSEESIDLIWRPADESLPTRYFEVKSGSPEFGFRVYKVGDSDEEVALRQDLHNIRQVHTEDIEKSLATLKRAINKRNGDGENCKGYIVFVPAN